MALDDRRLVKISKYLARHLRHDPARLGLTLGPGEWVAVTDLLDACAAHNFPITREELGEVVARNDKRRFGFDETGERLRANQGHSIPIDLGLVPATPPAVLFHGTSVAALKRNLDEGLRPNEPPPRASFDHGRVGQEGGGAAREAGGAGRRLAADGSGGDHLLRDRERGLADGGRRSQVPPPAVT